MDYVQLNSGLVVPDGVARQHVASAVSNLFPVGIPGAYRAASSRNKNTVFWHTSGGSADADTLADLPTLRRQSRDLVRNEALPAGAIDTMVLGVVGQGVVPQSRLDAEFLGLTDEQAAAWSRSAERIFNHVAGKATFDSECKLNFWQQQRLVYRAKLESGDVMALRRYLPRPGKALGVCVQIIEADRICTPLSKTADKSIREGVQVDGNGAPLQYWVMNKHPGETYLLADNEFTTVPAFDRNGNPLALLVMTNLRPGQTRGVPHLAPVVELFKQLGRYSEAEVSAAVTSAMLAIFVKSAAPVGPLSGGGMIPGQVGGQQIVPKGNGIQKMQSGMIVDLAPGEEIQVAEATRPNTAFQDFVDSVLAQIGTALGLPRDVLAKSYNSSYSAARAALQDAFRKWIVERDDLVAQFCQPVWNWVMDEAVASGRLDAPGYFEDPIIREAYQTAIWVGPPMISLDPVKDAKAAAEWNALGIKSKQTISAETGVDFDTELTQRKREKAAEDAAGLTPVEPVAGAAPAVVSNENKEPGDDEENS